MAVSRFQAEQGQTVRLRIYFYDPGGALYDPVSVAQVEVLSGGGLVLATIPAASIVHEAVGVYYVDWAISSTETLGIHRDRWTLTPYTGSPLLTATEEFYVYVVGTFGGAAAYIEVATVKAKYLKPSVKWRTAYPSDADIQDAISGATEIMDNACGRTFAPEETSLTLDGNGRPYIYFYMGGHLYRQQRIDSITVDGGAVDLAGLSIHSHWVVDKNWDKDDLRDPESAWCTDPCVICRDGASIQFNKGRDNVIIAGRFGDFAAVPWRAKDACGRLAQRILEDVWAAFTPFESESLGGWQYQMREINAEAKMTGRTGWSDIDAILHGLSRKIVEIERI